VQLKRILPVLALGLTLTAQQTSQWVSFGPDRQLRYRADDRGNRIMDFSAAGYRGGGVALPTVRTARTLRPIDGDNTAQVQAALDDAGKSGGGAVVLAPGTYPIAGTLSISASGVVLRGSGSGEGGTTIRLTGAPHRFLVLRGAGTWQADGKSAAITDAYVPSGANSFQVDDTSMLKVGDTVLVRRPVTEKWVHFMGMDTLVRDGKAQTWIKAGSFIRTDRVVKAIDGKKITLDVPLSDSIDSAYLNPPGATVVKYSFPGRISEVGVESLRIAAPIIDVPITEGQFTAFQMDAVVDGWARDIAIQETQNGIVIGAAAKRLTLDNVRIVHTDTHTGSAAPADFSLSGTQILVSRCTVTGDGTWPFVTQANVTGPIVILDAVTNERGVSPHQRWATGLLVDRSRFDNSTARAPGIAFSNRKTMGSGHGWDIGWGVAWNVTSPFLLVQAPPGSMNWCIGCKGEVVDTAPAGTFDARGTTVAPSSLYLEQLRERLGDAAVTAIGYRLN
jgi:hypothetical protein